jgi:tRNA A37 threonylcarbamoyltransferase TsaD
MQHCVDNGAMIAYVGGRYLRRQVPPPRLDIFSRWPVESLKNFYGGVGEA